VARYGVLICKTGWNRMWSTEEEMNKQEGAQKNNTEDAY